MIEKIRSKMKIVIADYSYEEYERNKGIYSIYLYLSTLLIVLFIGCFFLLSWIFHEFQFVYLVFSLVAVGVVVDVLDIREKIENEYLYYAKKDWNERSRTELFPRRTSVIEDSNFGSLLFYGRSVSIRNDVIITNDVVEYYIPTRGGIAVRNTLPVSTIVCRTGTSDRSFFVTEVQQFTDERFEFLGQQVGVPFQRSRMVIESNYIQWKG